MMLVNTRKREEGNELGSTEKRERERKKDD